MSIMKFLPLAVLTLSLSLTANDFNRNPSEYNLPKKGLKLALKGYDPVAYFDSEDADGNAVKGKAVKGSSAHALDYDGVIYHFSSADNLEIFRANPEQYEPSYGGWCAYAMVQGQTVDIDPKLFLVEGKRLLLFVESNFFKNVKKEWLKKADKKKWEQKADKRWKRISQEGPRNKNY